MLCFTYLGINISILEYISWGRHLAVFKIYDLTIKCVLTECFVHAINLSPKTNIAGGAGLRGCGISYDKEALRATFAAFVKIVATHSLTTFRVCVCVSVCGKSWGKVAKKLAEKNASRTYLLCYLYGDWEIFFRIWNERRKFVVQMQLERNCIS